MDDGSGAADQSKHVELLRNGVQEMANEESMLDDTIAALSDEMAYLLSDTASAR